MVERLHSVRYPKKIGASVYRTHYLLTLHLLVWFNVSTDHMDRELCKYNIAVLSCATSVTLINFIGMLVLIIKSLTCLIY